MDPGHTPAPLSIHRAPDTPYLPALLVGKSMSVHEHQAASPTEPRLLPSDSESSTATCDEFVDDCSDAPDRMLPTKKRVYFNDVVQEAVDMSPYAAEIQADRILGYRHWTLDLERFKRHIAREIEPVLTPFLLKHIQDRRTRAAIHIQACFRGWRVRSACSLSALNHGNAFQDMWSFDGDSGCDYATWNRLKHAPSMWLERAERRGSSSDPASPRRASPPSQRNKRKDKKHRADKRCFFDE